MNRKTPASTMLALLCAVGSAGAATAWQPVTIEQLTVSNGPREWETDCTKMKPDRLAITNGDLAKVSNAAVDDATDCLRFDYGGTTYYTRQTSAQTSATKRSTTTICNTVVAQNGGGTHVEAVTMGMGGSAKGCGTK